MSPATIAVSHSPEREHGSAAPASKRSKAIELSQGVLFYIALGLPVLLAAFAVSARLIVAYGTGSAKDDALLAAGVVAACFVPAAFVLTIPLLIKRSDRRLMAQPLMPQADASTAGEHLHALYSRLHQRV